MEVGVGPTDGLTFNAKELAALLFSVALGGGWNCGEEDNIIITSCILRTSLTATMQKGGRALNNQ